MMDALKDLKWPPALVVVAAFAAVVVLYALGAGLTEISTFISAVALAYGAHRLTSQGKSMERVEANTNGTLGALQKKLAEKDAQMIAMAQEHAKTVAQLTTQLPPDAQLPKTLTEDRPPRV